METELPHQSALKSAITAVAEAVIPQILTTHGLQLLKTHGL